MEHQLVTMKKIIDTTYAIKNELFNLKDKEITKEDFKNVFNRFGVVVDDGQFELLNEYKKLSINFDKNLEFLVLSVINISDLHYEDLNNPAELLSYNPRNNELSSALLKDDIRKRLAVFQSDYKEIKKIPKTNVMSAMKDKLLVDSYESVQKDLTKLFEKYDVVTSYEDNKGIINASKKIDKFPIVASVTINNLISYRIRENLRIEEITLKEKKLNPSELGPDRFKGILLA